jgi:hypothetical protein
MRCQKNFPGWFSRNSSALELVCSILGVPPPHIVRRSDYKGEKLGVVGGTSVHQMRCNLDTCTFLGLFGLLAAFVCPRGTRAEHQKAAIEILKGIFEKLLAGKTFTLKMVQDHSDVDIEISDCMVSLPDFKRFLTRKSLSRRLESHSRSCFNLCNSNWSFTST